MQVDLCVLNARHRVRLGLELLHELLFYSEARVAAVRVEVAPVTPVALSVPSWMLVSCHEVVPGLP